MKKLAMASALFGLLGILGCGPVQSDECRQYIECQEALDSKNGTTTAAGFQATYGEGGSCWTTNAETAVACTDACTTALDNNGRAYPEQSECQASGAAE